jgi:alpha-aminoadipate carrier protein LysW
MISSCPECDAKVALTEPVRLSEIVECQECGSELEILTVGPVTLALAPEIEEDWGE